MQLMGYSPELGSHGRPTWSE